MKIYCILFSGQAAQKQGMCTELWKIPAAREALETLTPILGSDLEFITTHLDDEELRKTYNAQRAIHAHHLGQWLAFQHYHPEIRIGAAIGHSMGIVAALVASGAMSIEDSGHFILARAQAFADVCAELNDEYGLMAAQTEDLQDLIDELPRFPDVELALYNSPGKGVVGGKIKDLIELNELAKEQSWPVYFRFLKVEGPYHTQALQACEDRLGKVLQNISIEPPNIPVFMGTSGKLEQDPDKIKYLLMKQATSTEMHFQAVSQALKAGFQDFLEVAHYPQAIQWTSEIALSAGYSDVTTTKVLTTEISLPVENIA
jgi:malonyl CoA-acyl carrier protein transacylase